MNEVDTYLAELGASLHVSRSARDRILGEVRDHFADAIADGREPDEVIAAFGSPRAIAQQFNAEAGAGAMRWAPVIALLAGIGVFVGFAAAAATQPTTAAARPAALAMQMSFFVGVLAFQVALVAGVCTASRAVATWWSSPARPEGRVFVRRSALLCVVALAASTAAEILALVLASKHDGSIDRTMVVAGALLMAASVVISLFAVRRLDVHASAEASAGDRSQPAVFAAGERCLDVVRAHPVVACAGVATVTALGAMSHAETTVAAALPWGIAQAAAVIAGFIVLGPALQLRPGSPR